MSCKDQQRSSKPKASKRSSSSMAYGDAQPKCFKASRKLPGHPKPKSTSDAEHEGAFVKINGSKMNGRTSNKKNVFKGI